VRCSGARGAARAWRAARGATLRGAARGARRERERVRAPRRAPRCTALDFATIVFSAATGIWTGFLGFGLDFCFFFSAKLEFSAHWTGFLVASQPFF